MRWDVPAAACVLVASMAIAVFPPSRGPARRAAERKAVPSADVVEQGGVRGLLDAAGQFVPIRPYSRIVSASSVSDGLLLELCEPFRVLGFTNYSAVDSPFGYRFAPKGMPDPLSDLEALIAREPDLVVLHGTGREPRVARLRDAGIMVFDLGEMRGLRTLLPNLRALGALLGRPARGAELAARFERRMRGVAHGVERRPSALYLSVYGDQVYGGTDGTSYHDVLTAAGLEDVATERFDDWPDFSAEQLLQLDPEVIVTADGKQSLPCARPGLAELRACKTGRVVGIDGALLASPGLEMLEAAEALFEVVHGAGAARAE